MSQPPPDVLAAFGTVTVALPIEEGRGLCFKAGDAILKPSDNDEEAEAIAHLCQSLIARRSAEYRVSRPIQAPDGGFVYKQWTAWSLIRGKAAPEGNFERILEASRAFHADIATLSRCRPAFLTRIKNRWTEADLVTWGEKTLDAIENVNTEIFKHLQPQLNQLREMEKPLAHDVENQLIHGDLTGNVLFDEDQTSIPGIIDITLYWRPAEYAEAIVVADGLTWHGQRHELVDLYGTNDVRMQLLVRALHWRILTFAIDPEVAWVHDNLPRANFQGALDVIRDILWTQNQHRGPL